MAVDKATKERRERAREELGVFIDKLPGTLKIVTAEVKPEYRQNAKDPRSPAKDGTDLTDANVFVQHNVTRLEEHPTKDGAFLAYTDEGDWMMGYPDHLVSRLQRWRRNAGG
jgi:hypothetical protein